MAIGFDKDIILPLGNDGDEEASEESEKSDDDEDDEDASNEEEDDASELCKLLGANEPREKKGDLGRHFLIISND